jgi:hypothetical protein
MTIRSPRRARRGFAPGALLALGLALAGSDALAQSDGDRATARAMAEEGQAALDRKDFETAVDRFRRADALVHAPTLLVALARAQTGLGKLVAAQEAYSRILREGVPAGSPPVWAKALDTAQKELDALSPRIPTLTILVKGSDSPQVKLDGASVAVAAIGIKRPVDPGKHVIVVTAEGMSTAEATVTVAERGAETVTLQITPVAGKAVPATPPPPRLESPPAAAPRAEKGPPLKTIGIAALAAGGAGLVLGAVTGGLAIGKHSTLASAKERTQADVDGYHLLGTLSTAGFAAGGVLAAGGVVLVAVGSRRRGPATGFSPWIGPGQVGATGRF